MYIVQNIKSGKYLKHNGDEFSIDFPYDYVNKPEQAEKYQTFQHAEYVAFWYADMTQSWRIVNTESKETYIKSQHRVGKYVNEEVNTIV